MRSRVQQFGKAKNPNKIQSSKIIVNNSLPETNNDNIEPEDRVASKRYQSSTPTINFQKRKFSEGKINHLNLNWIGFLNLNHHNYPRMLVTTVITSNKIRKNHPTKKKKVHIFPWQAKHKLCQLVPGNMPTYR